LCFDLQVNAAFLMVSSDFVGYFWLTLTAIGPTLGAIGRAGTGMLGGVCCNGEALSRFGIAGRWWTTFG
jgi:hypothetical protein